MDEIPKETLDYIAAKYDNNLAAFFEEAISEALKARDKKSVKVKQTCPNCDSTSWLIFGDAWRCARCKSWIFTNPAGNESHQPGGEQR